MSFLTATDIRTAAITLIDDRGSGIRTEAGEAINDLIDAFSLEGERLNVVAQYIQQINSISGFRQVVNDDSFKIQLAEAFGVSSITLNPDLARRLGVPIDIANDIEAIIFIDLNNFATQFGRPRSLGTFATGVLTLFTSAGDPFSLQRGQGVQTGDVFGTLYDTTTDLVGALPIFRPDKNLYSTNVGIRARERGRRGNQIIDAVNQALTPIANVVSLTNETAIEDGTDREFNNILLDALEGALGGTDINTRQGLINFTENEPDVFDAAVIGPGDPLMLRATAGAIDIYVIGSQLQTDTVDVEVIVEGEDVVLPLQPVRQINSVVGVTQYTDGAGFLTPENNSVFEFSSGDGFPDFTWEIPPVGPSAAEIVSVNFTHNALIRRLQRLVDDDPEREVPGSSLLYKEGIRIGISIEMKVIVLPGVTQIEGESLALDVLKEFFNALVLGQLVEFSDAQTEVTTAELNGQLAIDRVDGFRMGVTGSALGTENITVTKREFARLDTVTFIAP